MRIIPSLSAVASLALLAACGGGGANNAAGNAPAPAANDAAPAAAPATPAPAANAANENEVAECTSDVTRRNELAAGSDAAAFCRCAIPKVGQGIGERDAMQQCATELGIQLTPSGR